MGSKAEQVILKSKVHSVVFYTERRRPVFDEIRAEGVCLIYRRQSVGYF